MNEDLFGSIKQTITETAGAVGKKTEEFVETQKMRNKVRTLQREIRKKYADVGEIVYKRYVDGDTMDEELAGHCEVVMGLQKELAELKSSFSTQKAQWENEKCMPSLWNLQPERRCILYVLRCGTSGRRGRKRGRLVYPGFCRRDRRRGRDERKRRQRTGERI